MTGEVLEWDAVTPLVLDGRDVLGSDLRLVARCANKSLAELVSIAPQALGLLNEMLALYAAGRIIGEPRAWGMARQLVEQCGSSALRTGLASGPRHSHDESQGEFSFAYRVPNGPPGRHEYDAGDYYELGCELEAIAKALRYIGQIEPAGNRFGAWQTATTLMGIAFGMLTGIYNMDPYAGELGHDVGKEGSDW